VEENGNVPQHVYQQWATPIAFVIFDGNIQSIKQT
jgi:hypothetical protein